jgi:hypothetical protein
MSTFIRLATWGRALLVGGVVFGVAGACAGQAEDFQQAMQAYECNHWDTAFAGFAALADQGDARSARIALLMARFGPRLYATQFEVSASRRQQWLQAAFSDVGTSIMAATPTTMR